MRRDATPAAAGQGGPDARARLAQTAAVGGQSSRRTLQVLVSHALVGEAAPTLTTSPEIGSQVDAATRSAVQGFDQHRVDGERVAGRPGPLVGSTRRS